MLPPLQLDPEFQFDLALRNFHSYNDISNSLLKTIRFYASDGTEIMETISIPEGPYEIGVIETNLQRKYIPLNMPAPLLNFEA